MNQQKYAIHVDHIDINNIKDNTCQSINNNSGKYKKANGNVIAADNNSILDIIDNPFEEVVVFLSSELYII